MDVVLYIVAAVLFGIAAFLPPLEPYRIRFVAGGLLFWVMVPLLTAAGVSL
jgi:hypothetical protein